MNSDNTVASSLVSGVMSAVELIGIDMSVGNMASLIDQTRLLSPTSRVDFACFNNLLLSIQNTTEDTAIGLRIGRELALSSYNALGYAAANEKTLMDALQLLPKYESLVVSLAKTEVTHVKSNVEVCWSMTGGQYLAILEGLFFASWLTLGELLSGKNDLAAAVHFTHKTPDNMDIWSDTFGSNLLFEQPVAKVIFSESTLALPISRSDPFIHQVMTKEAED